MLVVDDEQDIRDLVLMWLSDDSRCAAVLAVADLDAAVQAVRIQSFDAVLIDFFLGAHASVQTCRRSEELCRTR